MSARSDYFKLGLFVIGASALIILALIFLGLGALRKDKVMVETYFDESVQGLDVGSPLKFKGVKIGSVERVRFVFNKYHGLHDVPFRYVLVEMALDPGSSLDFDLPNMKEVIDREVERGLRVRIAPQGLTGTGYLEMDYMDATRNKPLPIEWTPEYYYVPSAPSTIARLEETFEVFSKALHKIEEAGVDKAVQNINALLEVARKAIEDANVGGVSTNLIDLLADLRKTNESLKQLTGSKETKQALKDLTESLANLKVTTSTLPATIEQLRKLLKESNALLATQRDEVQGLLQQGKQTFENLNDLTGEAKRNPSSLLFGGPPSKKNPEKK